MPGALLTSISLAVPPAITGAFVSPDFVNQVCRGVKVFCNMTSAGSGSVVLTIEGKVPGSASYVPLLTSAAIASNGMRVFTVCPSVTPAANVTVADALPALWRISTTGNGSPTSYTIGAVMVP